MSYTNTNLYYGDSFYIFTNTTDKELSFNLTNRESGKTYHVISATIAETEEDPTSMHLGETVYFELVFPPLDQEGGVYDLHEGPQDAPWSVKNISLDKASGVNIQTEPDHSKLETLSFLLLTREELEVLGENPFDYFDFVLSDMRLSAFEFNLAGVVSYLSGNMGNAAYYFDRAIENAPMYDDPWINQYMLVNEKNNEDELRYIEGALKASPGSSEFLRLKAMTLTEMERYKEAASIYLDMIESGGTNADDYIRLGVSLILGGDLSGCDAIRDGLHLHFAALISHELESTMNADGDAKEYEFTPEMFEQMLVFLENACGKKYLRTSGLNLK